MIDGKTKDNLLKELEKSGNVYFSCLRVSINRSTYYRWCESDKLFGKNASRAIKQGRANNCDVAIQALMIRIKEKDQRAIEFYLRHNDSTYKTKRNSSVIILHKKESLPAIGPVKIPVEEEIIHFLSDREREYKDFGKKLAELEEQIPSGINNEIMENKEINAASENRQIPIIVDTEDSKCETEKPPKEPTENQKPSDIVNPQ
jgi:hypothetical protein